MAAEADKVEPAESEQDEEEDVYEVERIIDMRVEEGEVLYRVRWKNYCSDDDTWEPEAHLEDCHEVLLAFKRHQAELKSKKEPEPKKIVQKLLPTKSDVFDADLESDSDTDRPAEAPVKKKKKKKKIREEDDDEPLPKEKKKKKKEKRKDDLKPLPAPETDDDEEAAPPSPPKEKKAEAKKRFVDSDDEDEPIVSKKQKKEKPKEGGKHKKDKGEEEKKKKVKKQRKMETSEDEETAPMEEDLSEGPSESQMDDSASAETVTKPAEKSSVEDKVKQKKGKWEVKLQGIIFDKKIKKPEGNQKESSLPKPKSQSSKSKEDSALQSDSSDSSTLIKKPKSKSTDGTPPTQKAPSSSTSSSSSSSSSTAVATNKAKEEEGNKEEALGQKDASGSTNLFEKFLLNCEAKDRAPRRPPAVAEKSSSKPTKLIGKIEKISKPAKESPSQKPELEKTERTKQSYVPKPSQSYGFSLDSDEREDESTGKARPADDSRERKEKVEEAQRPSWERRTSADDRRKRREDSEPRLFISCDENQEPPEGNDKSEKGQATLSLGMDLNLDWMTLDNFQKHLNGEDEILSGPPLSPTMETRSFNGGSEAQRPSKVAKTLLPTKDNISPKKVAAVNKWVNDRDMSTVHDLEILLAERSAQLAERSAQVTQKTIQLAAASAHVAEMDAEIVRLKEENEKLKQDLEGLRTTSHVDNHRGGLDILQEVRAGIGEIQETLREQSRDLKPERPMPTCTLKPVRELSASQMSPLSLSSTFNNNIQVPSQHADVTLRDFTPEDHARIHRQSYGQVGRYGCLLFRSVISEEHYMAWSKTTNWDGVKGKRALPQNVKKFVVSTLQQKFPDMRNSDLKDCIEKINEFLRTTRKSSKRLSM
ncbi:M-phase phosphoprotein 8 isoform X3 [Cyprinodon tularosa]|uniref:M-phase phosphoprotein 8 isoform X3 n=1 Tax=Cyprinodon tularosa TaxID=77115 RepID=UPI0018E26090|nr:M-phase phosphoprotein 8 isoform X3 [Cyprinodon tularosa]